MTTEPEVLTSDTEVSAESTETTAPDAVTAFIVIKAPDGPYLAISDLSKSFTVGRTATLTDIRQGCEELRYTITKLDIVDSLVQALKPAKDTPAQTEDN